MKIHDETFFETVHPITGNGRFWPIFFLCGLALFFPLLGSATELEVQIIGLPTELLNNANNTLTITKNTQAISESQLEYLSHQGSDEVKRALQPFGYYNPIITTQYHLEKKSKKDIWHILYEVTLGKPVRIQAFSFTLTGPGASHPAFSELSSLFTLYTQTILNQPAYEAEKAMVLATVVNQGYLKAHYTQHEIRLNPERTAATITLQIHTGPLYRVGPLHFSPTPFNPSFLSRYAPFREGDPLLPQQLTTFQGNLSSSLYFRSTQVVPELSEGDTEQGDVQAPINVDLSPNLPNQYQLGMGYGTDSDLRAKLSYKRRYLNAAGHQWGATAAYSGLRDRLETVYTIPGQYPATDNYQLKAARTDERFSDKKTRYVEYDWSENRALGDWIRTLQLQYYQESFSEYLGDTLQQEHFFIPSVSWTKTVSDDALNPSRGYKLTLNLKGAVNTLLSNHSFIQGYLQAKYLYPIFGTRHIILRSELGATYPDQIDDLPIGLRYFTGGDFSVRGYPYKGLGPTIITENQIKTVLGGAYLLVGSIEAQQPLWKKASIATFWDLGNAFNRFDERLFQSVGLGLRWKTPIGPVRLDFAKPLEKRNHDWRIHFNLGSDL